MDRLVYAPAVEVVAMTRIDEDSVVEFAHQHPEMEQAVTQPNTPLTNLLSSADHGHDLDALPEFAGRFCYRSWLKGRRSSDYIANILEMEHGSVLEHATVTFAISGVSRALSHELVRHRAGCAISQESQRYVDAKDVRFVVPPLLVQYGRQADFEGFEQDCMGALDSYLHMQDLLRDLIAQTAGDDVKAETATKKRINEAARSMLPNATETRLVWTENLRAARHILALRGSQHADLEIRRLAVHMAQQLKSVAPLVFRDVHFEQGSDGFTSVVVEHPKV